MKRNIWISLLVMCGLLLGLAGSAGAQTPLGTAFTYQGRLSQSGTPVTDTCDFQFSLYDAVSAVTQIGATQAKNSVSVSNGLFTVELDFGTGVFQGDARWLEVAVRCPAGSGSYTPLTPRQALTPAPYALYAPVAGSVVGGGGGDITAVFPGPGLIGGGDTGDVVLTVDFGGTGSATTVAHSDHNHGGSYWSLTGNGGTTPGTNFLGTTDAVSLTLAVSNTAALRLAPTTGTPNLIGGFSGNSVTSGAVGGTIGGGGAPGGGEVAPIPNRVTDDYGTVGGGAGNQAGDNAGTTTDASYATVGGGQFNTAGEDAATVGGGSSNTASGAWATVGGGWGNSASSLYTAVGGGADNTASSLYATVGGGSSNTASHNYATVGGGYFNRAAALTASIGGGEYISVTGQAATVAGGSTITVTGDYAAVGGGRHNEIAANYATVGGGQENTASGYQATVGGGGLNAARGDAATVAGGFVNDASGYRATVGGGAANTASDFYTTVGGGRANTANGEAATVGGGWFNHADAITATIGGGEYISVTGQAATVAGGSYISVTGQAATVAGGSYITVTGDYAAVVGGFNNTAIGDLATVGGGWANTASDDGATVGGGVRNTASGDWATVGGGRYNTASGWWYATVGGGVSNIASSSGATVGGGQANTASGLYATVGGGVSNTASGWGATVPGGLDNTAAGDLSFAAGHRAKANNDGCFVWGDSTDSDVGCSVNNLFVARATGGVYFWTDSTLTTAAWLPSGSGTWSSFSDRDAKENVVPLDGKDVLARLAAVSISTWNYKTQDPTIRHAGPTAQDFHAAFGLGEDDRHIATVDADGVALAAIQGLYQVVQEKDAQIAGQQKQIDVLQQQNADLEARLAALEQTIKTGRQGEGETRRYRDPLPLSPSSPLPVFLLGGLSLVGLVLGQRWRAGGRR